MKKLYIGCCIALAGAGLCAQNKDAGILSSGVDMIRSGVSNTLSGVSGTLSAAADAVDPSAPNMLSFEMTDISIMPPASALASWRPRIQTA